MYTKRAAIWAGLPCLIKCIFLESPLASSWDWNLFPSSVASGSRGWDWGATDAHRARGPGQSSRSGCSCASLWLLLFWGGVTVMQGNTPTLCDTECFYGLCSHIWNPGSWRLLTPALEDVTFIVQQEVVEMSVLQKTGQRKQVCRYQLVISFIDFPHASFSCWWIFYPQYMWHMQISKNKIYRTHNTYIPKY